MSGPFQDVTDVRRLERDARLRQRLAAVGEMAAGIAHEIRNPLASMSGSIQVLRQELPLSEDQAQLMDIVLRESERLNDTIRSFLAYARPQRLSDGTTRREKVLQDAALLLRNSAEVQPHHSSTSRSPPSRSGARPMKIRSGRSSGTWRPTAYARWRTAAVCGDGHPGHASRQETSGSCSPFRMRAAGFAPEDIDGIFQPFRSSFERGTGLGLAIVHRVVTDYNGDDQGGFEVVWGRS